MVDRLSTGATYQARRLKSHASTAVVYERGAQSVSLSATMGSRRVLSDMNSGVVVETIVRDFILTSADLILGGSVTTPTEGDKITYDGETFEVLPPNEVEKSWRYFDNFKKLIRVHTKRISVG